MNDRVRTKQQLIAELQQLRLRVAELEAEKAPLTIQQLAVTGEAELLAGNSLHERFYDELLAQAVKTTNASIGYFDVTTSIFVASPQALAIHGLTPETALTHAAAVAVIHPEDLPHVEKAWHACIEQGTFSLVEYRIVQQDGTSRWIAAQGQCLPGLHGDRLCIMAQDITERKRAVEELRQSEARAHQHLAELEAIYRSTPIGLCVLDRDLRYVRINDYLAELNGMPAAEHIGRSVRELFPDFADQAEALLQQILETGKPVLNVELTGTTPSQPGVLRTCIEQWLPLKDAQGSIRGINVVIEEITERKRAEEALRSSEARYRTLHEGLRDGFVSVDMSGRLREWNQVYREMLGYTEEELSQLTYLELTPAKWHVFEDCIVREQILPRGYSDVYEKEYRRKDGSIVPVELRTILIRDEAGEPAEMWALIRDITQRKRAEEMLVESEERFRTLIRNSTDGIIILDSNGCVLEWNDGEESITGIPRSEALGQPLWEIQYRLVPDEKRTPNFIATAREKIVKGLKEGASMKRVLEDEIQRRDGTRRVIQSYLFTIQSNYAILPCAICRDITERKEVEAQLRASEKKYRSLFETMSEGFVLAAVVWDAEKEPYDYQVLEVNTAFSQLTGYSSEAAVGRMLSELAPDAIGNWIELVHSVAQTGNPARFQRYAEAPVKWLDVFVFCPAPGLIAALLVDITERKRAEEALRQSEERLQLALAAAEAGMWMWDLQDSWHTTPQINILFGRPAEGPPMRHEEFPSMVYPEDVERIMIAWNRTVHSGVPYHQEYRIVMPDRSLRWLTSIGRVVKFPSGTQQFLGVSFDITERKRMEEELQSLNETLERRVAQRTAALKKSQEQFRRLSDELLQAHETERKRIANEIHDNAGQVLSAVKYRGREHC